MTEDEKYMARCIQLARCGRNHAAPNPMVGAVIVCNGRIIGEGYHIRCGEAHAEVNAVRSICPEDKPLLKQSTIYVSLEPCSHYGKTPPCADLIISCGIPRVVVGCVDPFSEVAGRGIRKLRDAGINVTVGVLEKECLELNRRFIINHTEKRPYVILKWAQSTDGYIDRHRSSSDEPPVIFSNAHTSILVHRQRAGVQAIMVGRRTALLDNPSLTVRRWPGESPLRIVVDRELSLPETLHLFDGTVPTLVFTARTDCPQRAGVEYVTLDFAQSVIPQVLTELYARRIQSILVEGGSTLIQSFIHAQVWDEVHIEIAPITLGDGVKAPVLPEGLNKETIQIGTHWKEKIKRTVKN